MVPEEGLTQTLYRFAHSQAGLQHRRRNAMACQAGVRRVARCRFKILRRIRNQAHSMGSGCFPDAACKLCDDFGHMAVIAVRTGCFRLVTGVFRDAIFQALVTAHSVGMAGT